MTTKTVYVNPPVSWARPVQDLFRRHGYKVVDTIEACDIFVLTGGEDINPELYGEKPIEGVYFTQKRDDIEVEGYKKAAELGKFKFGICRGGQLLNVMNGGTLWQDVDNHERDHKIYDLKTGQTIWASSVHHQQFRLAKGGVIVAEARESTNKIGQGRYWQMKHGDKRAPDPDIEVAWYPKDRALCIQGHPEYGGYREFTDYCFAKMEELY